MTRITITNTESKASKTARIAATIMLGALGAVCLYAVLFMNRPDHLLTAVGYAVAIGCINCKDND